MPSHALSPLGGRSSRLNISLAVALGGLFAVLGPAEQAHAACGTGSSGTYSGGAISIVGTSANGSSCTTVSDATGQTVKTVSVTLSGLTSSGSNGISLAATSFVLQGPGGQKFVLLGATGDGTDGDDLGDAGSGVSNVTVNLSDTNSTAAPLGVAWQHTGSFSYKPSSYWKNPNSGLGGVTNLPASISGDSVPSTDGSSTLNGVFANSPANNTWTLTIYTDDSFSGTSSTLDPVSISGWTLNLTYNTVTSVATTTSLSSSVTNPAATSGSITYTATVTSTSTVNGGTVAFTASGSTISGCSAVAVSNGVATCTTNFGTQGLYGIVASYSGATGFASSVSSTFEQLVEHPTTATGNNTFCNTGPIAIAASASTSTIYPSVIKVTGFGAQTVSNVEVQLLNVQGNVVAQHLLVAPGGGTHNLDFFDEGFSYTSSSSGVNLNFYDSAGAYPNSNGAPVSGNYEASDTNIAVSESFPSSSAPTYDSSIPQVPGTINYGYNFGDPALTHGPITNTFENNFSGVTANGTWALYPFEQSLYNETIAGGWCIVLTVNTGNPTTTTVASSHNPQIAGTGVTLTANVTSGGNPVSTGGTVTFLDNQAVPSGNSSNAVTLGSNGVAQFATGITSYQALNGDNSHTTIYEGDHDFAAEYSGSSTDDPSVSTTSWQRFDNPSTVSGGGPYQYCNAGTVISAQGNKGAYLPNPSNIFVSNLPGTVNTVSVLLKNMYTNGETSTEAESLLAGPTHAGLDFFSRTGSPLSTVSFSQGNYTFADSGGSTVPSSGFGPGTFKPTSYATLPSSPDTFTSSPSGYNVPSSFSYAAPAGSATLTSTFGSTNGNGTWSLFFNETAAEDEIAALGGWCLNLTENPVTASVTEGHNGNGIGGDLVQGETGGQLTTVVTNNGTGTAGDPAGGNANPLTVVDTLNAALTYSSASGTGWSCSVTGQTVTCTNDEATVAQGAVYPTLTVNVNVTGSAPASITNQVTVSGADVTSTTGNDTITVDPAPKLAVSVGHTGTFTQGSTAEWDVTVSNTASGGRTNGTITMNDTLPAGYTLSGSSATGGTWGCSGVSSVVTCTSVSQINGGSSSTIAMTVNVPANSAISVSDLASAFGGGDLVHTSVGTAATSNVDSVTVVQVPAAVTINSGNSQSATIGTPFASPLSATVRDAGGVAIASYSPVSFAAATGSNGQTGTFSNSSSLISTAANSGGQVSETITANSKIGIYTVTVTAGTAQNSFTLTNTVGAPASVAVLSGSGQSTTDTTTFTNALVAQVLDAGSNPVPGVTVTFTAPAQTGASLTLAGGVNTAITDGSGDATSAAITANNHIGTYAVTASAAGGTLQTSFSETNTVGAYSQLALTTAPPVYATVPMQFTVSAVDVGGNVVTTATPTVQFSSTDGAAALPANATLLAGTGTFMATLNATGSQTITATDTSNSIAGTSGSIQVTAIPNLVVTTAADDAGTASNCTPQTTPGSGTDASCSLRDALLGAASLGAARISFDSTKFASATSINAASTLNIPSYTSIQGPTSGSGATLTNLVTVNGGGSSTNYPGFTIGAGVTKASIANLVISQGNVTTNGGGIQNQGNLTITGSTVSGNSSVLAGGGIYNSGTLTVYGSSVTGNSGKTGGGLDNENSASVTLTDATISGNTAGLYGGGINSDGTLTVADSTVSGNFAGTGGSGIYSSGGTFSFGNLIVSGNQLGTQASPGNFDDLDDTTGNSTLTTGNNGGNLIGYYNTSSSINPGINLAPLGNYGGPTHTMLPLPGSVAICGGLQASMAAGITNDQRALPNTNATYPGYSAGTPCVDSGAVQSNYSLAFSTQPSPVSPATSIFYKTNFQAAVTLSESGSPGPSGVTIPLTLLGRGKFAGGSASTSGGIASYTALNIDSPGANDTLTAAVTLNGSLSPSLTITTTSSSFQVGGPPFGWVDRAMDAVTQSTTVKKGDKLLVLGWAADVQDGAPVSLVEILIDGNVVGDATLGLSRPDVAGYPNSGWKLTYSVSGLSVGTHTISAVAHDSLNLSGTLLGTKLIGVVAAGTGPPFGSVDQAINALTGTTTVAQGDNFLVTGWAADPKDTTPVTMVKILIDGNLAGNASLGYLRPDVKGYPNSGWKFPYAAASLSLGTHSVTAVAYDSLNLSTTLGTKIFTVAAVNTGPPFGFLDTAVDLTTGSTTVGQADDLLVAGWAADPQDGAPLSQVQILIDGTAVGNATLGFSRPDVTGYPNSGWKFTIGASGLSLGTHTITAAASDSLSLSTTLGTKTITVQ